MSLSEVIVEKGGCDVLGEPQLIECGLRHAVAWLASRHGQECRPCSNSWRSSTVVNSVDRLAVSEGCQSGAASHGLLGDFPTGSRRVLCRHW